MDVQYTYGYRMIQASLARRQMGMGPQGHSRPPWLGGGWW
jgi:hypothetical protein